LSGQSQACMAEIVQVGSGNWLLTSTRAAVARPSEREPDDPADIEQATVVRSLAVRGHRV
jgi:hypothetical protein